MVFDGYGSGRSIKVMTHQHRKSYLRAPVINFTETMLLTFTEENFLSNLSKKQNMINLITDKVQSKGCYGNYLTGRCQLILQRCIIGIVRIFIKDNHVSLSIVTIINVGPIFGFWSNLKHHLCYGKIGIEINFVIDPTWV
jgi:hypothetical protein